LSQSWFSPSAGGQVRIFHCCGIISGNDMSNHETMVEIKLEDIRILLKQILEVLNEMNLTRDEQMAEPIDARQD